jgi:hypothetical protein
MPNYETLESIKLGIENYPENIQIKYLELKGIMRGKRMQAANEDRLLDYYHRVISFATGLEAKYHEQAKEVLLFQMLIGGAIPTGLDEESIDFKGEDSIEKFIKNLD